MTTSTTAAAQTSATTPSQYPDAGHGGVFQHHDRFVPAVLDFLR